MPRGCRDLRVRVCRCRAPRSAQPQRCRLIRERGRARSVQPKSGAVVAVSFEFARSLVITLSGDHALHSLPRALGCSASASVGLGRRCAGGANGRSSLRTSAGSAAEVKHAATTSRKEAAAENVVVAGVGSASRPERAGGESGRGSGAGSALASARTVRSRAGRSSARNHDPNALHALLSALRSRQDAAREYSCAGPKAGEA